MGINMVELGRTCMRLGHDNRTRYDIGEERVEICHDCFEWAIETLKIDSGWYAPYG